MPEHFFICLSARVNSNLFEFIWFEFELEIEIGKIEIEKENPAQHPNQPNPLFFHAGPAFPLPLSPAARSRPVGRASLPFPCSAHLRALSAASARPVSLRPAPRPGPPAHGARPRLTRRARLSAAPPATASRTPRPREPLQPGPACQRHPARATLARPRPFSSLSE